MLLSDVGPDFVTDPHMLKIACHDEPEVLFDDWTAPDPPAQSPPSWAGSPSSRFSTRNTKTAAMDAAGRASTKYGWRAKAKNPSFDTDTA